MSPRRVPPTASRDHGRGHHVGRRQRRPGPARHPHPPGASRTAARRALGRRRLHLPGPPRTSRPRTSGHRQRATAGQPHPPAPQERGLQPGRLPHRLRPPTGHLPPGPGQPGLARPLPDLLAHRRPADRARFTKSQCRPCPARTRCTTTADSARTVGFPPRELRDLQLRVRAEQQTPDWKTRYAVRSGVEGTINEFAHGTACPAAATADSRKPTCNTYSRPSP
ncbi:transposase [Streptomyces plumbiresistens]|uniref:transposase n=1 Tax=Streptomyces plumbiresistens TaxID=511811 RepID=UPI0031E8CAF0